MNYRRILFAAVAFGVSLAACAEEAERDMFGKWRFSVGGAFNSAVRSSIGMRNLPAPSGFVPSGMSRDEAFRRAHSYQYEGGGYVAPDELNNGWNTENWKLPTSAYRGNGLFVLDSGAYQDVVGSSSSQGYSGDSPDPCQYGLSFELSRELWAHDEAFEHRWGVDFAVAVSYFFQRNAYRGRGYASRSDSIREGRVQTVIDDPDAMYEYDNGEDFPVGGMYGHGTYVNDYISPALLWENIGLPYDADGQTRTVSSSRMYSANGDYRELEMLFMLRPWYEITDWWRVYGELGVGVSWGNFESEVYGSGLSCGEDFSKWDCYGVAGLGTMFRYGMFDLSLDFLGRFLRDDLDVDGRYLNGAIRRSDWGFRVMVGVEF